MSRSIHIGRQEAKANAAADADFIDIEQVVREKGRTKPRGTDITSRGGKTMRFVGNDDNDEYPGATLDISSRSW